MLVLLSSLLVGCGHLGPLPDRDRGFRVEPPAPAPLDFVPGSGVVQVQEHTVLIDDQGIRLERWFWTFRGQTGFAWDASVELPGDVRVVYNDLAVPFGELLPYDPGPWAAINGNFYEEGPIGLVKSDGFVLSPLDSRGGTGVFVWRPEGPSIVHWTECCEGAVQALQSIDQIVEGGQSLVGIEEDAGRSARSAVAVGRKRLHLVTIAARQSVRHRESGVQLSRTVGNGLPLWAFADFLVQTVGAVDALNLDGAISSSLSLKAPGERYHLMGEQGTSSVIVIRPAEPVAAEP